MTVDVVKDFICTVGFPIACAVALYIQNNKLTDIIADLKISLAKMGEALEDLKDAIK